MSYKGDTMMAVAGALQYKSSSRDMVGGRLQVSNRGKAGLNLKVRPGLEFSLNPTLSSKPQIQVQFDSKVRPCCAP